MSATAAVAFAPGSSPTVAAAGWIRAVSLGGDRNFIVVHQVPHTPAPAGIIAG